MSITGRFSSGKSPRTSVGRLTADSRPIPRSAGDGTRTRASIAFPEAAPVPFRDRAVRYLMTQPSASPHTRARSRIALLALVVAQFVVMLDTSIVNVAL